MIGYDYEVPTLKGRLLTTNFISNTTKAPNVTLEVVFLSTDDFRAYIERSTDLSGSEINARAVKVS